MGKFPAPAAFSGRFFPLLSHRSGGNSNRKWGGCTLILNKIGPQIPHPLGEAAPAAKSSPVWAPKSIGILGMLGVLGDGMSCGCGCGWGYHRQPPNRRAAALQLVGRKSLARGQGILPLEFVAGIPGEHMDAAIGQEMGVSLLEEGAFPGKRRDQPPGLLQTARREG